MIRISVTMDGSPVASVVALGLAMGKTGALVKNAALRIADEHRAHFLAKDAKSGKPGWPRSHFWSQIADATSFETKSESEATVIIADRRMAIHVYGGTVRPVERRALTIPIHPMAKGVRVSVLANQRGMKIFRIQPKRKKPETKGILAANIDGKLVALYVLRTSAKIPRDRDALPPVNRIQAALEETVADFIDLHRTGGAL